MPIMRVGVHLHRDFALSVLIARSGEHEHGLLETCGEVAVAVADSGKVVDLQVAGKGSLGGVNALAEVFVLTGGVKAAVLPEKIYGYVCWHDG